MKKIIPIIILAWLGYLIFSTSCANIGNPIGGDKDTIPPVVVETEPEMNSTLYDGNTVSLTFDEFIIPEKLSEVLIVSPPLPKRPRIKTKSKTLIVELGENLKENTTYSLDYKDAIVDNNEKNPLEDFRFAFSTGETFDSLMIGGYVKQADNLEPIEGALVVMHKLTDLSAFKDSLPNYIAKTDEEGLFIISNIAAGSYRLYAILDGDNSLTFNASSEQIAFYDTLVVPHDWNVVDILPDTLGIVENKTQELPSPYYLMMYEEEYFNQYLDSYKRSKAAFCHFYFSEGLTDSFKLEMLYPEPIKDWAYMEFSTKRDSLQLWITDTLISQSDSMIFRLDYIVKDTLDQFVYQTDTLEMFFKKKEVKEKKKKKKDDKKPKTKFISLSHNLSTSGFDVYKPLRLTAAEPLQEFDFDGLHLYQQIDTLEKELDFEIVQDSLSARKFVIDYPWEFETSYKFVMDSAIIKNYSGYPNNKVELRFSTQKEGYYAKIILTMGNVNGPGVVQLLENKEEETVLQEIRIKENAEIEFPLLKPAKYKMRFIVDSNDNGKWDKGDIENNKLPEQVIYYQKILKLRSNFEVRETWTLPQNIEFRKELVDEDQQKNDSRKNKKSRSRSSR